MSRNRIFVLILASGGLTLLLIARIFQLQIVQGDYWEQQLLVSRFKSDPVPFHRGSIFDRYGRTLAVDEERYGVEFLYGPFRRGHVLGQMAHLLSLTSGRRVSLLEVASEPERAQRELARISALDLWNLPTTWQREDARDAIAKLLHLASEKRSLLRRLATGSGTDETALVSLFPENAQVVAAGLEQGLEDLFRLEAKAGWKRGEILSWIEERRVIVEAEIEKRFEQVKTKVRKPEEKRRELRQDWESRPVRLASEADYELAHFLTLDRDLYPGFRVARRMERAYPAGIAFSIVGLVQRPNDQDLDRARDEEKELLELSRIFDRSDEEQTRFEELAFRVAKANYQREDQKGKLGLEAVYERALRGEWGSRFWESTRLEIAGLGLEDSDPVDGEDIVLTLDAALQAEAEAALREGYGAKKDPAGAIVILDCRTGEILAMASHPSFVLEDYKDRDRFRALNDDARHPFHPKAFRPFYAPPPGSVFKLMVAAAALEKGIVTPATTFECKYIYKGLKCNNAAGHGSVDLREAIAHSCNVYFYRAGEMLGVAAMAEIADRFGFGKPSGFELRELPGAIYGQKNDPLHFAIGQTLIEVTPLQVANAYAALANGGTLLTPHVVGAIGNVETAVRPVSRLNLSSEILRVLEEGMAAVVATGTARPRSDWDLRKLGVVGKTGTAEVGKGVADHAWFAGYLPAESPVLAFCVFLERAGMHGGDLGAPIAYRVLSSEPVQRYLEDRR